MEAVADEGNSTNEESKIKSSYYNHFAVVHKASQKHTNIIDYRS